MFKVIENSKSTENSIDTSTVSTKNGNTWQGFPVDISPVNKERVYVVTPQPIITTPKSNSADKKKEKAAKATDKNAKVLETETKKTKKKSNTFESIEKAYQVLPQAVNNLAVASTGPESVPLWGIMEHEEFASLDENEHENEDNESPEIPVLYAGHSKVYTIISRIYIYVTYTYVLYLNYFILAACFNLFFYFMKSLVLNFF